MCSWRHIGPKPTGIEDAADRQKAAANACGVRPGFLDLLILRFAQDGRRI